MERNFSGKTLLLGDNIDTDQIFPGRYLELVDKSILAEHCLEGVDPNISKNFNAGDIIVAGRNFGCGSSREHAPLSIISMGASAVIAESFARIFFRNAINVGLPVLVCKGIREKIKDGCEIEIDMDKSIIKIIETGEVIQCQDIGEYAKEILESGGLKEYFISRSNGKFL